MGVEREGKLSRERLAAVLVHMSDHYVDGRIRRTRKVLRAQRRMIKQCAKHDVPLVVLLENENPEVATKLRGALQKVPRTFVTNNFRSGGFAGEPDLDKQLKEWNIDTLLNMGVYGLYCVWDFAQHASERGYKLATAKDLTGDDSREELQETRRYFAQNGTYYRGKLSITK